MDARRRLAKAVVSAVLAGGLTGCGAAARRTASEPEERKAAIAARTRERVVRAQEREGPLLSSGKVAAVSELVSRYSRQNGLESDLVYGVIWVESRFDPEAVSPVGARGLMQLMPKTAEYLADRMAWEGRVDAFDPEFNIAAGCYYLAKLIPSFGGDVDLALAAYNAGPTNVRRWLARGSLPDVAHEYAAMVGTAREIFREKTGGGGAKSAPSVTDGDLDRLGLAILLSGFHEGVVGADRADEARPFE